VDLYDEISPWGITAAEFAAAITAAPAGDLDVHVNSPGGDVWDGLAILNTLRQHRGQVTVTIDGLAASAASVVAMAASPGRLYMAPNSIMMIHDAWALTVGNEADHTASAELLGEMSGNIADVYARRAGQPASAMREAMQAETWYIGAEAVAAGLADSMLPGEPWDTEPEPGPWDALSGAGRPGNAALRAHAYSRYVALSGRGGKASPFAAAIFRP
jgi:ATP-dependent Clp endopeptidase proteolytic subunit ClpP